jgi:hypothetical protein
MSRNDEKEALRAENAKLREALRDLDTTASGTIASLRGLSGGGIETPRAMAKFLADGLWAGVVAARRALEASNER